MPEEELPDLLSRDLDLERRLLFSLLLSSLDFRLFNLSELLERDLVLDFDLRRSLEWDLNFFRSFDRDLDL